MFEIDIDDSDVRQDIDAALDRGRTCLVGGDKQAAAKAFAEAMGLGMAIGAEPDVRRRIEALGVRVTPEADGVSFSFDDD